MASSPSDIKGEDENSKEWSLISGPSIDSKKAKVVTRSRGRGRGWLRGSWEVREEPHETEVLIQDLPPPEIIIDRADDEEDLSLGEESQKGSQTEMRMQGSREENLSEPPFEPVHFDHAPTHLQHSPSRIRCINMPTPPPSVIPPSKSAGPSASRHEQAPAPPIPTPPSPAVLSMSAPQLTIIHQPSGVIPLFLPLMPGQIACQQLPVQSGSTKHSGQLPQPAEGSNSDAIQVLRGMVGKHDQPVTTSQPLPSMPDPPRLLMRGAVPPPLTLSSKVNPTQSIATAFRPPPRLVAAPGLVASTATPAVTVSGSLIEEAASSSTVTAPLSRSMSTVSLSAEKNSIPPSGSTLMVTSLAEETLKAPVNPPPSPSQKHVSLLSPALSASTLAFATHQDKDPLVLPSLAPSESTPARENLLPLPAPTLSMSTTAATSLPFGKNSLSQPSPAQLLTLPASILKRVNVNQPLALKINNRHIVVPPYCLLKSKEAVKVVLPPGTFSMPPNSETTFPLTVSNNTLTTSSPVTMTTVNPAAAAEQGTQLEAKASDEPSTSYAQARLDLPSTSDVPFISVLASDIPSTSDAYASLDVPSSSDDSSLNKSKSSKYVSSGKCHLRVKSQSQINPSQCMMHRLFGGFDAMLQIFQFLQIPDLLHASQVCSTWLQIARQRTLWQSVNLKDLLVADWEKALKFMRSCGTQKLLLKGVKHKGSQSQAWQILMENLDLLMGLRHIEFGLVPAAVVHAVVEKLTRLEVFKAEHITLFTDIYSEQMWTTPTKLDVGKFGSLVHLRELRLRGVLGLVLPTFTFNGSLSELAHLKHLHSLSLTSLHAMRDSDFNFLADMKHLRELELGNCLNWTSQTYLLLGELRELRHLRLECGGEIPDIGLGDALLYLTKLERLELILFVIPASLNKALSELTCLHTLVLWPDTGCGILPATVNSNAVAAVLNVKHLQVLEWGLMVKDSSAHSKSLLQQTEDSSTIPFDGVLDKRWFPCGNTATGFRLSSMKCTAEKFLLVFLYGQERDLTFY
ncbi:hypothetical protein C0Q70_14348 [Pomacea canaliculata]|uniref:F-box domain-containing protein n=1 Tax=Pomacea canaliculata TaxID=400727 RepID=A0A2T7NZS5_POMCA|nr:hypothetical protein C0Q70_14348 [Pomacea canaliculata]